MRLSDVGQAAQRTLRARSGGEVCIAQTRKVAMQPWKLKWPRSVGRVDFQLNVCFSDVGQAAQRTPRVRRARGWVVLHCAE